MIFETMKVLEMRCENKERGGMKERKAHRFSQRLGGSLCSGRPRTPGRRDTCSHFGRGKSDMCSPPPPPMRDAQFIYI